MTLLASSISSAVRWRMKTGLPRHLMMTCKTFSSDYPCSVADMVLFCCSVVLTFLPSGMALRSTSTLAMAKTSAEADMLTRNSAKKKEPNQHFPFLLCFWNKFQALSLSLLLSMSLSLQFPARFPQVSN